MSDSSASLPSSPLFPPESPTDAELNFDLNFDSITFFEVLTGQNILSMAQDIRGLLEFLLRCNFGCKGKD
jgi:hypothetical protein